MMGKTHTTSSLAIVHTGLALYVAEKITFKNPQLYSLNSTLTNVGKLDYVLMSVFFTSLLAVVFKAQKLKNMKIRLGLIITSLICIGVISPPSFTLTVSGFFFLLGGLLPDIDSEKSVLGRYMKPLSESIEHRAITHSIWFILLFLGISFYFKSVYLYSLTLGIILHMVADSFSMLGVRWFYPLGEKGGPKYSYRVGGTFETIIFWASVGVNILCFMYIFVKL